jgi:protoporphyrinogen oxidase
MTRNVAIVGSGILGMTLALRLSNQGHNVTIFESSDKTGGLAAAWSLGDITWDKHYHVTLASDIHTVKLLRELGLEEELRWNRARTGFYADGRSFSMSGIADLLRFPPLSPVAKLRIAATILYASRLNDWRRLEQITVEEWLTKLSGSQAFERIWKPLLLAKLGDTYRETSAAFIWATIKRFIVARKSRGEKGLYGYVTGGYARVLERFEEVLTARGVVTRLNATVRSVERMANGKVKVITAATRRKKDRKPFAIPATVSYGAYEPLKPVVPGFSGAFVTEPASNSSVLPFPGSVNEDIFDAVILTCPSAVAAEIVLGLSATEKRQMANIRYQGVVCASLLTKASLSPYFVTNLTDPAPFTSVIEMSALVDKREFDHCSLLYLPKFASADDQIFRMSDAEIQELFLSGLEKMYRHFKRKDVVAFRVSRVPSVFPIPVLNYSSGLTPKKTRVDGVYVVNSSHTANGTLNVNETVALAEEFLSEVKKDL